MREIHTKLSTSMFVQKEKAEADRKIGAASPKDLNAYLNEEAALVKKTKNEALAREIKLAVENALSESGKVDTMGFFD